MEKKRWKFSQYVEAFQCQKLDFIDDKEILNIFEPKISIEKEILGIYF